MTTRPERILDDWPRSAEEALLAIERYHHLSRKFAHQFEFSLTLFHMPVAQCEVEEVLNATDRLAAAKKLVAKKINRWG